jgi:hypothetical protein
MHIPSTVAKFAPRRGRPRKFTVPSRPVTLTLPLMVKFPPSWLPFFKRVVKLPDNILFRVIGSFNMCQELLFYRVRPVPALRYFRNTVLMTGSSGLSMTLRTIPSLFRRKTLPSAAQKEIYESGRGYF